MMMVLTCEQYCALSKMYLAFLALSQRMMDICVWFRINMQASDPKVSYKGATAIEYVQHPMAAKYLHRKEQKRYFWKPHMYPRIFSPFLVTGQCLSSNVPMNAVLRIDAQKTLRIFLKAEFDETGSKSTRLLFHLPSQNGIGGFK